ncbi:hypothetical protein G6553_10045 [Nocardioides sp. IC4_145]|uniref:hypothetical protein n=1 Tax=Nocardioides sp. IC4_145 TaxID=2714037 RepID=UPI00140E7996|nr:hypothetical protein [Nocardioides sp. IC4_145]NHC23509.1 hypothetical protein [Nocardioides sp. IC4_145]
MTQPLTRTRTLRRAVATTSLLLIAPFAAACGGGDDDEASAAPQDASSEDFCDAYTSIFDSLLAAPSDSSQDQQEEAAVDALKDWSERMREVGTPEDLPEDARKGFELVLDEASDIDDVSDLQDLEDSQDYSEAEQEQAQALNTWITENCAGSMPGLPSGDPSAELPSEPSSTETTE